MPLADFVSEAIETAEAFGRDLLVLDRRRGDEPDPVVLNAVFRAAHSLKGLAGMFGQSAMAQLAHTAEDLLERLRHGRVPLSDAVLDGLLESVDLFQRLATAAESGGDASASAAAEALGRRLAGTSAVKPPVPDDPLDVLPLPEAVRRVLTAYEEHRIREAIRRGRRIWRVGLTLGLDDFDLQLGALGERVRSVGELLSTLPGSAAADPDAIAFELLVTSDVEEQELRSVLVLPVELAPLQALSPAENAVVPPEDAIGAELTARAGPRTVRVDIERLDALMNTVGELRLIAVTLRRMADSAQAEGAIPLPRAFGLELMREARVMERKLGVLQGGLLEARMVPLGQMFDRLTRLVRRITRESGGGKELAFVTRGGDVELDKLILEELSDPLMHLIRNAIDHGIESPQHRLRLGKSRSGTISLRAEQEGNNVIVEVEDDGAGIDTERVRQVAVERGLVGSGRSATLSDRDVHGLLFVPGFTTAARISTLSGRGVGLDVVKTNIARLGGVIDVTSRRGTGTRFRLTLPLTLAMVRSLLVVASGRAYAIPLNNVLEILSVTPAEVQAGPEGEVISFHSRPLPFARLARVFQLPEAPASRHFVVVVGQAEQRVGLAVDELLGQQDLITKPLGERLRHIRGISGAAELGSRRTVLVLDVGALLDELLRPGAMTLDARAAAEG